MTTFMPRVTIPNPYPPENGWTSGSVARATTDIAVVVWMSDIWSATPARYRPMHMCAVRWTSTGPEFGPTLTVDLAGVPCVPVDVQSGRDLEVWALVEVGEATTELRLSQITVNPSSLVLTHVWKHTIPSADYGFGSQMESWVDEELLVIFTGNGDPADPSDYNVMHLVHMDAGLVETIPTVEIDTFGTRMRIMAMGLDTSTGTLLVLGDELDESDDERSSVWRIAVTSAGFGTWTRVGNLPPLVTTGLTAPTRWATMAASPSGWHILEMANRLPLGYARWFLVSSDFVITEGAMTDSGTVSDYYDYDYSGPMDAMYDAGLNKTITTYADISMIHREATAGALTYTNTGVYDLTMYDALVQHCTVAPGHYVYMIAQTGIGTPGANWWDSFGVAVYLAGGDGETAEPDLGGQTEETRRAFRRSVR